MPNYTKNLGLTKPLPEEFYDVNVRNENWDKIDTEIGNRVSWSYEGIVGSGSIKDWAVGENAPTTVAVAPAVTDMPFDNEYWLVSLEIAATGSWRILTAISTNNGTEYIIMRINGVWREWAQIYNANDAIRVPDKTKAGSCGKLDSENGVSLVHLKDRNNDNSDRNALIVNPYSEDISGAILFARGGDGLASVKYKLYGEHYSPAVTATAELI